MGVRAGAVLGLGLFFTVTASLLPGRVAFAGVTERVSVSSAGEEGNGDSWCCAGANGYVAFLSNASNLVAGDTNGTTDVFVRDLLVGMTERVSVSTDGEQAVGPPMNPTDDYREVAITPDGRYVAFASDASNLVTNDSNGARDVFVRDRLQQITERVSVSSSGEEGNAISGDSCGAPISADGRYVVFVSEASNLVSGDTNGSEDVFLRDREGHVTECVSVDWQTGLPAGGCHGEPAMSSDGRFVAFSSDAPNVVSDDSNGQEDIFLRDRLSGTTERISVNSLGQQADGESFDAWVSDDGRYVAFDSWASNLVDGDMNWSEDVFLRDRQESTTECVSVNMTGAPGAGGEPTMSEDGRFVAFMSSAADLVPSDTNGAIDTFVRDMVNETTVRVSLNSAGQQTGGGGGGISADGRALGLVTTAADLVEGDTNGCWDVFVRDLGLTDVPKWHWAWRYIEGAKEAGIVQGYPSGNYHPEAAVNRAGMAVYIARGLDLDLLSYEGLFPQDVPDTHWAWPWIEALARAGVVGGYWNGYHPDDLVNRAQMAVYIARSLVGGAEVPTGPAEGSFPDVPDYTPGPAHWAYDEIEYCYAQGVVQGYWNGYHPDEVVNRAQMPVYVCRAFALTMPPQPYNVTQYYPLCDGNVWSYHYEYEGGGAGDYAAIASGTIEIGGRVYERVADSGGFDPGYTDYLQVSEDGIRWGGNYAPTGPHAGSYTLDPPVFLPNGLDPGDGVTQHFLVYQDGVLVQEGWFMFVFLGLEEVTVPAGTFADCFKFESANSVQPGLVDHSYDWLAKGVGRVREDIVSEGRVEEMTSAEVCGEHYGAATYNVADCYPLDQGNTWTWQAQSGTETATVSGTETINGLSCSRIVVAGATGGANYLAVTSWGVLNPACDDPDLGRITYVPPAGFANGLAVGEERTETMMAYLNGVIQGTTSITYRLLAVENVTVPAGTFPNCLKLEVVFDWLPGHDPDHCYEWLAPGVGMVKDDWRPFGKSKWHELASATVGGVHYP